MCGDDKILQEGVDEEGRCGGVNNVGWKGDGG